MSQPNSPWRHARTEDDDAIVSMCLALNAEDPGPRAVPQHHTRATLARFRAEPVRGRALVLELEGKPAGYCLLASFWSNELGGEICIVDELFVIREHREKGHGRDLLEGLISGSSALWNGRPVAFDLEATPANQRARAFYESLGFRPLKNSHLRLRY